MSTNPEMIEYMEDDQVCLTATQMMTWKIPDFSKLPVEANKFVDSPPFLFEDATWCVRLYPHVKKEEVDYVGFTLEKLSSQVSRHKLHCNLMIKGDDIAVNSVAVFLFDEEHKEKERMEFICSYLNLTDKLQLSKEDVLTLKYQVFNEIPAVVDCRMTGVLAVDTKDLECLCLNFKDLFVNGNDHDVVLKVKDKEFHAHQNILRARSPVLKSMLTHDMVEKKSGVVDIPDCDPYAFEQFLIYLYCGEVETLDPSNMLALYYLADKYDVLSLKEKCRPFVKTSLSYANIAEVIQLAMNHSDAELLERATDYFVKNVNKILPTVKWQCFVKLNPIQANELFIKAAKKMSEGKL